jgi:hypothetical protein
MMERVAAAFGIAVSLYYLCRLLQVPSEPQEIALWALLLLAYPAAVARFTSREVWRRALLAIAAAHALYAVFLNARSFGSWPLAAVNFAALLALAFWVSKGRCRFLSLAVLLYAGTRLGDNPLGLPLFQIKYLADVPVWAGFGYFSWRIFTAPPAAADRPRKAWGWYAVFTLFALQPLYQLRDGALHHWSFYVGIIELVRQGGLLLWDVPSQYGLLSIALPAALPLPPWEAFRAGLAVALVAQAALTFHFLQDLPLGRFARAWAGLVTLALVFWLPGDHADRGVLSYPNTGAYRFIWVLLLAWLLSKERSTRKNSAAIAIVFAVGCLWGFDGALYCSALLGVTVLAEAILTPGTMNERARQALRRLIPPALALVAAVFTLELVYRGGFGVAPDWSSYTEFSRTYGERFSVSPIEPEGALNLLLFLFALAASVWAEQKTPASFAFLGVLGATFGYFVARSWSANVYTLLGVWLPGIAYLVGRSRESRVPLMLLVGLFAVLVPASIPDLTRKNLGRTLRSAVLFLGGGATVTESPNAEREAVRRLRDPSLPLVSLAGMRFPIPPLSTPDLPYQPWLVSHPSVHFCLLPSERRRLYLSRQLARWSKDAGQLLRPEKGDEPEDEQCLADVLSALEGRYAREASVPIAPNLILETYRRR